MPKNNNKFFNFSEGANDSTEIDIFDEVIGWDTWSGEFKQELSKIPSNHEVVLNLNSPGGVITEGLAMYSMLRQLGDRLTVRVYGIAASIASVIALAGGKLIMTEGSFLMIHNPFIQGYINADSEELRSTANALDAMKKQILNIYKRKWNKSEEELLNDMNSETFYDSESAVEVGFAEEAENMDGMRQVACFDDLLTTNSAGKQAYLASISKKDTEDTSISEENELVLVVKDLAETVKNLTANVAELKGSVNVGNETPVDDTKPDESDLDGKDGSGLDFLDLVSLAHGDKDLNKEDKE